VDSKELNTKINALCDKWECSKEPAPYECFDSGKVVPYIGWFWRHVNFDTETYELGIIPIGADGNERPLVGFMENNKWGHPYIKVNKEDWAEIKRLLWFAVEAPTHEALKAVDDKIQSLAEQSDVAN